RTGPMERAMGNAPRTGDKVITVNGGKFGERWGKIARAYGLKVDEIEVTWGEAVSPTIIEEKLDSDPSIRAVLMQASETSTGVKHPTDQVAAITSKRDDVLLIVDGITAVGVFSLPFDELGIDVLVGGSQKAFMLPPGLSFATMSEKAWEFNKTSDLPKFYLNFADYQKSALKNTTPWTPAVTLIIGLGKVIEGFMEEGMENIYRKREMISLATREALGAINIDLFTTDAASPALTVGVAPEEIGAGKIISELQAKFSMTVAGGQDHAKGKIFRVSHIGDVDRNDMVAFVSALESILGSLGHDFTSGAGVAKISELLPTA
ncbi:MAG: alanine--glyoxylate aminotransferase family protein, partial [Candidatus Dadabacteria bacterium]|nr:alanine--glyoxylate aminotransferase family protein [Candidatus Dadabacteria bacterium]